MIAQKLIPLKEATFQTLTTPKRCMFVDVVRKKGSFFAVAILDTDDKELKDIEICMYEAGQAVDVEVESLFYIRTFTVGFFRRRTISVYNKRRFADDKRPYRPYAEKKAREKVQGKEEETDENRTE